MSKLTIAAVCPLMALSNPSENLRRVSAWTRTSADKGADLVLFPEIYITGYATEKLYAAGIADRDQFLSLAESVPGPITDALEKDSRRCNIFICAGMLEKKGEDCFNTQVLIDPQKGYVGCYRKTQVSPDETWFSTPGRQFPVFDIGGVPTGIMICRDKSHPEVARILALEGAQLLLVPHAAPAARSSKMGFTTWSLRMCVARAMENGVYLIANNCVFQTRAQEHYAQCAYSFAIDPYGEVIHCDEGSPDEEKLAIIEVDTEIVRQRREMEGDGFNLFTRSPELYQRLVSEEKARE